MKKQLFYIIALCSFITIAYANEKDDSQKFFEEFITQINQNPDKDKLVLLVLIDGIVQPNPTAQETALELALCDKLNASNPITLEEKKEIFEKIVQIRTKTLKLIHPGIPAFLKALQNLGVKIIGITFNPPLLSDAMINHMESLNVDFSLGAITMLNKSAETILELNNKVAGLYKKGVLFVQPTENLETLLQEFFAKTDFKPTSLIVLGNQDNQAQTTEEPAQ